MVIVIKDADFSVNNIGTIEIPRIISDFTLAAVTASGKNMSSTEIEALDVFFDKVGALTNDGVWAKLNKVYLPFIGNDVTYGLLNYKTNEKDNTLNAEYLHLVKGGVKTISDSTSVDTKNANNKIENVEFNLKNSSIFMLNTTELPLLDEKILCVQGYGISPSTYMKTFNLIRNTTHTNVLFYNVNQLSPSTAATYQEYNADFSAGKVFGYTNNNTVLKFLNSQGVMVNTLQDELPLTDDVQYTNFFMFSGNNYGRIGYYQSACGAVILGEYLTDAEALLLKAQLETLYGVFKEEEEW